MISACLLQTTVAGEVETYKIDPAHSSVTFKVRHFFTPVPGRFSKFKGIIKLDRENPANNYVEAFMEAASVDTNNERRDNHLRRDDFFNTSVFPAERLVGVFFAYEIERLKHRAIPRMKVLVKNHPEDGGPGAYQDATKSMLLAQELCLRKDEYENGGSRGGDRGGDRAA